MARLKELTVPPRLEALSNAFGPSGREQPVRRVILDALQEAGGKLQEAAAGASVDSMGNLEVKLPGRGPVPAILLAAHMDEVGLIVSGYEESGLLRFKTLGGIDTRVLLSRRVRIGPDDVPGVIGQKPVHLLDAGDRESVPKLSSLFIDIGAASAEEAKKTVPLGEAAVFDTRFARFGGSRVKGKALDDRAGCSLLLDLLVRAAGQGIDASLHAAFTVQEELGLRGAGTVAHRLAGEVDFALVLEATTCADLPGVEPHEQATALGAGPVLTVLDGSAAAAPALLSRLIETAEREGIPWQFKRTAFGGTDAGRIHLAGGGIPTAVLAVPCRYIHSPAAIMDLGDYHDTLRLLAAFLGSLGAEGKAG